MSTLIVRDVVGALVGDAQGARALPEVLRDRADAAGAALPPEQVEEYLDLIAPLAGEDAQPDVLLAALVLALSHPRASEARGISAPVHGRYLASRLEGQGDLDGAYGALSVVAERIPGNPVIERALASLMRRKGMVSELVDRYLDRAQRLLDEGRHQEAIPWLREVLQLDRSRKDVARMIRDLRFEEVATERATKRKSALTVLVLALSLGVAFLLLRESRLSEAFAELPQSRPSDPSAMRTRLAELEAFMQDHPIWHGALSALRERSLLRVEIDRIEAQEAERIEQELRARERADSIADSARELARRAVDAGDFGGALEQYQRALEVSSEDWAHRDRTRRDVEAIVAYLGEEGQ